MLNEQKETSKPAKNIWRFINAITETGEDLAVIDSDFDKDYNPRQINTLLSRHLDTIAFAHQMNMEMLRGITSRHHFYYLLRMVPKKRRYAGKISKQPVVDDAVIEAVSEYTKQSAERAIEYIRFLSDAQIKAIVNSKGGVRK